MKWLCRVILCVGILCAGEVPARGDLMQADGADNLALSDGSVSGDVNAWAGRVGEYYGNGSSLVIPFQLPTLGAGEMFATASLEMLLYELVGSPEYNVDIYGLGSRTEASVLSGDFYWGALDGSATLIQNNFATPASSAGSYSTDAAGDTALAAYLNAQYAGGAGAGDFVFIRLSMDVASAPAGNIAYVFTTQDAGGAGEKPQILYTAAIPEPSTLALITIGMGGILRLCSKRRVRV